MPKLVGCLCRLDLSEVSSAKLESRLTRRSSLSLSTHRSIRLCAVPRRRNPLSEVGNPKCEFGGVDGGLKVRSQRLVVVAD
jgi:hypothetical protein